MPPYDPDERRKSIWAPWVREVPGVLGDAAGFLGKGFQTGLAIQGLGGMPDLSSMEVGQKKALGVDMAQPTYPPQTPAAPSTTRPQGGSPETPNTPPYMPDNQFAERPSPFRPDFDAKEWGQKRALDGEGSIRFKEAGGDWQDYDRGTMEQMGRGGYIDSAVGANASPEEWRSRVANPEAFSSYGESLDRVAQDAQLAAQRKLAQDPFAAERFKTDEELRQERAKQGMLREGETERAGRYNMVEQQRNADLAALRSNPAYRTAKPEDQTRAEARINNAYDSQLAALDRASGRITAKAQEFGGGGMGV